jgi:hypothetical protein
MRKALTIAVLTVAATAAHANDDTDRIRTLTYRTTGCMQDGAAILWRMGQRDQDPAAQWLATTCGIPLARFLEAYGGVTREQAAAYIFEMGRAAVRDQASR